MASYPGRGPGFDRGMPVDRPPSKGYFHLAIPGTIKGKASVRLPISKREYLISKNGEWRRANG